MMRYPRLLVATEFPPNAGGGGAAIVRQMLRDWPTNQLMWWSCRPDEHRFGVEVGQHEVANIPSRLYPHVRFARAKAQALENIWAPWAARHLRRSLRQLQPDIVWAIPHLWSIPVLARVLLSGDIPYHVSVHDFPDANLNVGRFGRRLTTRLRLLVERLYRAARSRDVISTEMADSLQSAVGKPAEMIGHAGVEPEDLAWIQDSKQDVSGAVKIGYAGTIIAAESFSMFAESLGRIRSQLSRPVELHLFGAQDCSKAAWFSPDWVFQNAFLNAADLNVALRKCHWGFAPMELSDDNPRYNRFSLPTKLVSYLAAGLPVITLAHRSSTTARLAQKYSFGIAIDDTNVGLIDPLLLKSLEDASLRSGYRSEVLRCAHTEFDADSTRNRLIGLLSGSEAASAASPAAGKAAFDF